MVGFVCHRENIIHEAGRGGLAHDGGAGLKAGGSRLPAVVWGNGLW